MGANDLLDVAGATVTDLDFFAVEDGVQFMAFREVFIKEFEEFFTNVGF